MLWEPKRVPDPVWKLSWVSEGCLKLLWRRQCRKVLQVEEAGMHSHRNISNHAWTWKYCFRCLLGVAHGTLTTSQWERKLSVDAECPLSTGVFAVFKGKCERRSGGSPSSRKPTGEWGPQTPRDSGAAEAPSLLPLFPEASRLGCERLAGCSQRLLGAVSHGDCQGFGGKIRLGR